jgi:hypothetical protein
MADKLVMEGRIFNYITPGWGNFEYYLEAPNVEELGGFGGENPINQRINEFIYHNVIFFGNKSGAIYKLTLEEVSNE